MGRDGKVKVSDFGLSRDVYTCDYYKVKLLHLSGLEESVTEVGLFLIKDWRESSTPSKMDVT